MLGEHYTLPVSTNPTAEKNAARCERATAFSDQRAASHIVRCRFGLPVADPTYVRFEFILVGAGMTRALPNT
jgi:hypothetical protein